MCLLKPTTDRCEAGAREAVSLGQLTKAQQILNSAEPSATVGPITDNSAWEKFTQY